MLRATGLQKCGGEKFGMRKVDPWLFPPREILMPGFGSREGTNPHASIHDLNFGVQA